MTTIAFRDGVIAADSWATYASDGAGAHRHICTKLYRKTVGEGRKKHEVIIATAGEVSPALCFLDWYGTDGPIPHMLAQHGGDFACLILTPRGLFEADMMCRPDPVLEPFYAIGSGCKAALAAMHCGKSALDAVRIAARNDPKWQGVIGSQNCQTRDFERHAFLEIVDIDGIAYSHYFANTHSGRPIGGTIPNRLSKIGRSFVCGHEQGMQYGMQQYPGSIRRHGLVAGSFYQHCEGYRGPQGRDEWRGIVVLNEVRDGDYCVMPLTLAYLRERYDR